MTRTLVDLFAGAGGLGLGMEFAGFMPVFVSELHSDAMATYLANRPPHAAVRRQENRVGDITHFTSDPAKMLHLAQRLREEHGDIDLIAGGPPCQGYSGMGHRRTFTDLAKQDIPSNHLYSAMATFIGAVGPKAFLFENVRGLKSSRWTKDGRNGEIWDDVMGTLKSIESPNGIGYTVREAVVFAKDYGVPQNRPRVLIVGVRKDLGFSPIGDPSDVAGGLLPRPTGPAPNLIDVLGDLVDPGWYPCLRVTDTYPGRAPKADADGGELARWLRTARDGSRPARKGSLLHEHEYSSHGTSVQERFLVLHELHGNLPPDLRTKKFAQRLLPSIWAEKGPTITVASLPDDYVHFSQPRTLTVREWARLQTFPDWYEFVGKRTTGGRRRAGDPGQGLWSREVPKYTQIGNAVPVLLANAVGRHLSGVLERLESGSSTPDAELHLPDPIGPTSTSGESAA